MAGHNIHHESHYYTKLYILKNDKLYFFQPDSLGKGLSFLINTINILLIFQPATVDGRSRVSYKSGGEGFLPSTVC